jgi:putative salt-induced outer membrane protein YdiY
MPFRLLTGLCLSLLLLPTLTLAQEKSQGPVWSGDHMPTKYDWVLLTSGEWLKGDLIAMYDDDLEFDSDEMGVMTLDWADISEVRTKQAQSLRLTDGRILEGQLFIDANTITLYQADGPITVPRSKLHTLASADTGEWDFWSGKITLGANLRSGNTQQDDYSFFFKSQRRTSQTRMKNEYNGAYSTVDGKQTENNHRFTSTFDYFFTEKTFFRPMSFAYFADRFKNIDYRVSYTAGVGYEIFDGAEFGWEVFAGAGWQETYFESVQDGEDDSAGTPVADFATELNWDITSDIEYIFSYGIRFVNEDSGKYNSHMETGFDIDLVSDLEFSVKYIWDRTQEPTADQNGDIPDRDDSRLVFGLTWDF